MVEYNEMRERRDQLAAELEAQQAEQSVGLGGMNPLDNPTYVELLEVNQNLLQIRTNFTDAVSAADAAHEPLQEVAAMRARLETDNVPLMSAEEQANFTTWADGEMADELETYTGTVDQMVEVARDPVFREDFQHWEPAQQIEFLESFARHGGNTESGRALLAELTDGIAQIGNGEENANGLSEGLVELRQGLGPGGQLDDVDANLGLIAGIDQSVRPEGAAERLDAMGAALGIPQEDIEAFPRQAPGEDGLELPAAPDRLVHNKNKFVAAAALGYNAFQAAAFPGDDVFEQADAVAGLVEGSAKLANFGDELTVLGRVATVAERVSPLLMVGSAAYEAVNGNGAEAVGALLGAAGAAVRGPWGVGLAVLGAAVPMVMDEVEWQGFRNAGLEAALGPDMLNTFRGGAIANANAAGLEALNYDRHPSQTDLPAYFNERLREVELTEGRPLSAGDASMLWTMWELNVNSRISMGSTARGGF